MECFASLSSKKLLPILTSPESYLYLSIAQRQYPAVTKTSTFISNGRLVENCIYTQFNGPPIESTQLATISPGNSAIFVKLPNYTYYISWKLDSKIAKLWTIDADIARVFEMYTTSGRIAEFHKGKGRIEVYGFNFPLVVELPMGSSLTLEVTLGRYLSSITNPLSPGRHCLLRKLSQSKKQAIYNNVVALVDGVSMLDRIVEEDLEDINAIIRGRYFRNYRLPCVGITPSLRLRAIEYTTQVLEIYSDRDDNTNPGSHGPSTSTISNYVDLIRDAIGGSANGSSLCPVFFTIYTRSISPLETEPLRFLNISREGSGYPLEAYNFLTPFQGLTVEFTFNFTISYNGTSGTVENPVCGTAFPLSKSIGIFDGKNLLRTTSGKPALIQSIGTETSSAYSGSFIVALTQYKIYVFGGTSLVRIYSVLGNPIGILNDPAVLDGIITCKVV